MKHCATLGVCLLAAALVPAAPAQDKEAEKLFRDMEKKLEGAKAFELAFTYRLEGKTTRGSLLLTKDNKARLRVSGPFFFGLKRRANAKFEMTSDGNRLEMKGAKFVTASNGQTGVELGGQMKQKTPKTLHAVLVATVCRGGIGLTVLGLPTALTEFDPDGAETRMKVYDFEAGAAEKVGERQAKVVHYRFGKGGNDDPKVSVWIDAKTCLPLKRSLLIHPESEKIRITEAYREFELDPKIDAKTFDLPK